MGQGESTCTREEYVLLLRRLVRLLGRPTLPALNLGDTRLQRVHRLLGVAVTRCI